MLRFAFISQVSPMTFAMQSQWPVFLLQILFSIPISLQPHALTIGKWWNSSAASSHLSPVTFGLQIHCPSLLHSVLDDPSTLHSQGMQFGNPKYPGVHLSHLLPSTFIIQEHFPELSQLRLVELIPGIDPAGLQLHSTNYETTYKRAITQIFIDTSYLCNQDTQKMCHHIDDKLDVLCILYYMYRICPQLHFSCKYRYHEHCNQVHQKPFHHIGKVHNWESQSMYLCNDHMLFLQCELCSHIVQNLYRFGY